MGRESQSVKEFLSHCWQSERAFVIESVGGLSAITQPPTDTCVRGRGGREKELLPREVSRRRRPLAVLPVKLQVPPTRNANPMMIIMSVIVVGGRLGSGWEEITFRRRAFIVHKLLHRVVWLWSLPD